MVAKKIEIVMHIMSKYKIELLKNINPSDENSNEAMKVNKKRDT